MFKTAYYYCDNDTGLVTVNFNSFFFLDLISFSNFIEIPLYATTT